MKTSILIPVNQRRKLPQTPEGHHCAKCKVEFTETSEAGILASVRVLKTSLVLDWVFLCFDCAADVAFYVEGEDD